MGFTLLLLAAGLGTRYGGLKQLEPVGPQGEILLDYSIHDAVKRGCTDLVFVIRREMFDHFRKIVGSRYEKNLSVSYIFQELTPLPGKRRASIKRIKPWGTAHAVLMSASVVKQPFIVINADDYYGPSGFAQLSSFLDHAQSKEYAMVGYYLDKTLSPHGSVSRGICRLQENGLLSEIMEHTGIVKTEEGIISQGNSPITLHGSEPTSMNFWGFTMDLFPALESLFEEFLDAHANHLEAEFYLPDAINSLIKSSKASVRFLKSNDHWAGLTYPEDRASVVERLTSYH